MKRHVSLLKDCHGSITVLMFFVMFLVVAVLAFVIDMAHVEVAKNEIQNAADACALRGARAFLPDNIPLNGYYEDDPNPVSAKEQAQITIADNKSDNTAFQYPDTDLPQADIEVGIWDYKGEVSGTRQLLPWEWPPPPEMWGKYIGPGISLPTKRSDSVSLGSVVMTLANVFGIATVDVHARATAALSGVGKLEEGYAGSFPIAVDEDKVHAAGDIIFLSPDMEDVGGWTSLSEDPASAKEFKDLINHSKDNPEVWLDKWISLQNGVACSAIKEAIDYYNTEKVSKGVYKLVPPVEVVFPVVQVDKFNQSAQVKGFMAATIDYFRDSNAPKDILIPGSDPPKYTGDCMIILTVIQGSAGGLPGGGRWYGVLSPYPKLVE